MLQDKLSVHLFYIYQYKRFKFFFVKLRRRTFWNRHDEKQPEDSDDDTDDVDNSTEKTPEGKNLKLILAHY